MTLTPSHPSPDTPTPDYRAKIREIIEPWAKEMTDDLIAQTDEQYLAAILALLPGYWLADPKYRNLAADKDHGTDYFVALGHDKAIDQITVALTRELEEGK